MNACERCGSYAVNPGRSGRDMQSDLDLCDVCYWRKRAEQAEEAEREACADAESDAGRLALELECLLLSTDMPAASRWWDSANEALNLHRSRLDAIRARGEKGGE